MVLILDPEADESGVFSTLAQSFAEHGIVALLYGRREAGKFSGSWSAADLQSRAGDVLAAVKCLQQRPDIRRGHVGFLGFGRNGWLASCAASREREIAFVITLSTPAISAAAEKNDQTAAAILAADSSNALLPGLRSLRAPLLMLFGEKDEAVPVEQSVALIQAAMRAAGRKDFAYRVLPGADHGLLTKPYHDSTLPLLQNLPLSPRFEPEALDAMVYWIKVAAPFHNSKRS